MTARRKRGWSEWIIRDQDDGTQEYSLVCAHGSARSETIRTHYSQDLVLGLWVYLNAVLPDETSETVLMLVLIQTLLGRLLEEEFGCQCGLKPLVFPEPAVPDGEGR